MDKPAGSLVFPGMNRFQALRQLGAGGMGIVYAAFDRERNVKVALKTLPRFTPESLRSFKNEFRSIQDIRHPNLVTLDELMEVDGTWFFTMELVEGVDFLSWVAGETDVTADVPSLPPLGQGSAETTATTNTVDVALAETGRFAHGSQSTFAPRAPSGRGFDEARLRDALRQLIVGISALHDAGKIHRDIKPSNVLVTSAGRVVILDFGLVSDPGLLEKAAGTAKYMAPEQVGGRRVGPETDWYGVGVTLYAALTGNVPFQGQVSEILELKQTTDPPPPSTIAPGVPPDLDELCMALLRRNPRSRPTALQILEALGVQPDAETSTASRAPAATFVGRTHELAVLESAFEDTSRGKCVAVLVHGESGVGKSALVRRFLDDVSERGSAHVLAARCYERESVPYKAVDQVMEGLATHLARLAPERSEPLLPPRMAAVAEVFPAFHQVPAIAEAASRARPRKSDPTLDRAQVFATLRELLLRVARRRHMVVSIDDLQWADVDSLALLADVLRGPDAPPVLFVATVRVAGEAAAPAIARLRGHLGEDTRALCVTRLPLEAASELAGQLVSSVGGHADAAGAQALAREADGHPMFIDALVRHRALNPSASGPVRLEEALIARTASLGPEARRALEFVCVAGGPIQQEACAHAVGVSFGVFGDLVGTLRVSNLVKTQGIHRGDVVEPYHDRVREAIAAQLAPADREATHAKLARALEASGTADPEVLVVHFREGGDPRKAARYATRAAERAQAALAFDRSAQLYRTALELDPGPPAQQQRVRIRLGEALAYAGRSLEAAELFLAAAADAPSPEDALELRRLSAGHYLRSGRIAEGLQTLEAVLATVGMHLPPTRGRAILALIAERIRLKRRGLGYTRRNEADVPVELRRKVDVLMSMYPLGLTDTLRGHRFQTMNLRLSLDAGVPGWIVRALSTEIIFVGTTGQKGTTKLNEIIQMAHNLAAEAGDPFLIGGTDTAAGAAATVRGEWRLARERCERAEKMLREECAGAAWELDTAQIYGTRSLFYLGDIAELRRRLPAQIKEAHERGDLYLATNLRVGYSMVHACLAADDPAAARRQSEEAFAQWTYPGMHIQNIHDFMGQLSIDLYAGDLARAEQRVAEIWPQIARSMYLRMEYIRVLLLNIRARVAVALAAAAPAGKQRKRHLAAARKDARTIRKGLSPWTRPMGVSLDAGLAACQGDTATAIALLDQAERDFAEADMPLFAMAAQRQRGLLVGGPEGAAMVASADLWMREQTIERPDKFAELLVPGFARPATALALGTGS